ncbi:GDSL-type esterase/lipase family protein [Arcanobacterium pinnipediorum]|uniref:GDSL-type esterase/lipase family protein n=1 Tax=Arcanobacterium pinnipediorum TaxID=1503041 RepID=A0ABY5AHN6_9ACTO|nr:GDSL-type esterase/lipase family protein [Arcanobacterium pinnipediorum]USR79698.1 GDSL-type esterase/lipase family protein [Arcanobacterium pinnipediorum]
MTRVNSDHPMRIMFVGDELVAGFGDARALGWTGRVMARTHCDPPLLHLTLATPGEGTEALAARWEKDVVSRMDREADNRLVLGLGSHDMERGLSLARSRLYVANILDNAISFGLSAFVVGPPPRNDQPLRNQNDLSQAFADVCARRNVPYVDCFTPLYNHEQWSTDMSMTASYTPRQAGYGLMAWLVLHKGWHEWLGVSPTESTTSSH